MNYSALIFKPSPEAQSQLLPPLGNYANSQAAMLKISSQCRMTVTPWMLTWGWVHNPSAIHQR